MKDAEAPRVSSRAIRAVGICALGLSAAWMLDPFVLKLPVLTPLGEQAALSPLYAFFQPKLHWSALFHPLLAIGLVLIAPRLLDTRQTSRRLFAVQLAAASVLLPFALFSLRDAPRELGSLLTFYPGEEVLYDALRITSLSEFYEHYIDFVPQLSLHGQHFPPGHATWLHLLTGIVGDSTRGVGIAVLLLFAGGMLAIHRALACWLDEERARQGALLCLACPALLDFACTSMDAVFFAAAGLALWLALAAFKAERGIAQAAGAGAALFVAILLSYSALPLGLLLLLIGLSRCRRGHWDPLVALGVMGSCFAGLVVALGWLTGFHLLEHFEVAHAFNEQLMTGVIGQDPRQLYWLISYGNAAAFLIATGLGILGALVFQGSRRKWPEWRLTACIACVLGVLAFGNIHQMETERIWIYAVPWLALLALEPGRLPTPALRTFLAAGLIQALLMELFLFTLW